MFTVESLKNIQLIFTVQLHKGENQMNTKITPGGGGGKYTQTERSHTPGNSSGAALMHSLDLIHGRDGSCTNN